MQDMYLQRRHALSTAPPQLPGMATMAGMQASSGRPQQQGYTATFMPASATQHLVEEQGRAASLDGVRPSRSQGTTASAPAVSPAVGPERVSTGSAPASAQPHGDTHEVQVPWVGTRMHSSGDGAVVGGPAGFGSTMSAAAGDGSIRAQHAAARLLADMPEEGSVPDGSAAAHAPDVPTHPFAIEVGPVDDRCAADYTSCTPACGMERAEHLQSMKTARTCTTAAGLCPQELCGHHVMRRTEPLPSPFTATAASAPAAGVGAAGGSVGLGQGTSDGQLLARSMEVALRPTLAEAQGPPTASQSLEPATSIPDRIIIGQRARRATRVGKHGTACRASMPCVLQSPAPIAHSTAVQPDR